MVGSSLTWLDDEIESLKRNEDIPDSEVPLAHTCRSLGSPSYRKLFAR